MTPTLTPVMSDQLVPHIQKKVPSPAAPSITGSATSAFSWAGSTRIVSQGAASVFRCTNEIVYLLAVQSCNTLNFTWKTINYSISKWLVVHFCRIGHSEEHCGDQTQIAGSKCTSDNKLAFLPASYMCGLTWRCSAICADPPFSIFSASSFDCTSQTRWKAPHPLRLVTDHCLLAIFKGSSWSIAQHWPTIDLTLPQLREPCAN